MTYREAQLEAHSLGMILRKTLHEEYRVAFPGRLSEASAYYTNDLEDAVETMRDMARRKMKTP